MTKKQQRQELVRLEKQILKTALSEQSMAWGD